MTKNLARQIENYAIYLPALSRQYAEYIIRPADAGAPASVRPRHLNFLNPNSPLYHYPWCLASAGHFAYGNASNAITRRDPKTAKVMGDTGGFQVATGALKAVKGWIPHRKNSDYIVKRWNASGIRQHMLNWVEANCDYAMSLDMPLWVHEHKREASPFHYCSVEQLTAMTVANLKFIDQHRGAVGNCKFLNVLQGQNEADEEYWYRNVCGFDFEGWAFGTKIKRGSEIDRILRRILMLRDANELSGRKEWLHILGVSEVKWAVALTAIQRGIQQSTGSSFTVSFDSSTPMKIAGQLQNYAIPPKLTRDIRSWSVSAQRFPVGHAAATINADQPFPEGSPISPLLTVGDMNPKKSSYDKYTFGTFSPHALSNHNLYVYLRAFIDANDAAFNGGPVPQPIADLVGLVGDLFAAEQWQSLLKSNAARLRQLFGKPGSKDDVDEVSY